MAIIKSAGYRFEAKLFTSFQSQKYAIKVPMHSGHAFLYFEDFSRSQKCKMAMRHAAPHIRLLAAEISKPVSVLFKASQFLFSVEPKFPLLLRHFLCASAAPGADRASGLPDVKDFRQQLTCQYRRIGISPPLYAPSQPNTATIIRALRHARR